jgi:uncharacterized coiled-coil protein SlyX
MIMADQPPADGRDIHSRVTSLETRLETFEKTVGTLVKQLTSNARLDRKSAVASTRIESKMEGIEKKFTDGNAEVIKKMEAYHADQKKRIDEIDEWRESDVVPALAEVKNFLGGAKWTLGIIAASLAILVADVVGHWMHIK